MPNFDPDDPLGDLLSDGSNDSFFEEPKVLARKASLTKTQDKKSVTDLFGLDVDKPPQPKKDVVSSSSKDDWLGISNKTPEKQAPSPAPRVQCSKPMKKISFEEDTDDLFGSLGLDNSNAKKPEKDNSSTKKNIDFMDSILGTRASKTDESKKLGLFEDLLPTDKKPKSAPSTESLVKANEPSQPFGFSLESGRESRRSRQPQSSSLDPLGLLPSVSTDNVSDGGTSRRRESPVQRTPQIMTLDRPNTAKLSDASKSQTDIILPAKDKDLKTKSAPNITELPDWLGGAKVRANASEMSINKLETEGHASVPIQLIQSQSQSQPIISQTHQAITEPPMQVSETVLTQQKLTSANVEYQNTAIALQQQESQVLMALQLRKYENSMSDMQRHQQELLIKQEQSFNTLLDRQFAKQQMIENNIRLQQERINNHIQLLVTQPASMDAVQKDEAQVANNETRNNNLEEMRSLYEGMITALKQRHHEEIFLMEESYKKQLSTLEQTTDAIENRLKQEIDDIISQHNKKLELLKEEHNSDILTQKSKLEDLVKRHEQELQMVRDNQNRVIDEIKYEHSSILENIKHSRQKESSVVQEANAYTERLEVSMRMLEVNSRVLSEMQSDVSKKYGVITMAREESIKTKEEEINLMRLALDKAREDANDDRSQLMTLVRTLELKLTQQHQDAREERLALQQAAATLTARTAALDRESEFSRHSVERERDQLKTIKESMMAEQEQAMLRLTEEKLAIAAEKSRLEVSLKLASGYNEQRSRTEVEAAIKVAQEAAQLADTERDNLHRRLCEMESSKRKLSDKERKLQSRERELEALLLTAEHKAKEGEDAMLEAQLVRSTHNDRLWELQKQLRSLAEREKRLANDKIALSKERLALHNLQRRTKRCSLCTVEDGVGVGGHHQPTNRNMSGHQAGEVHHERPEDDVSEVEQDIPRFISASDAEIFRLQLKLSEDQLTSNYMDEEEPSVRI